MAQNNLKILIHDLENNRQSLLSLISTIGTGVNQVKETEELKLSISMLFNFLNNIKINLGDSEPRDKNEFYSFCRISVQTVNAHNAKTISSAQSSRQTSYFIQLIKKNINYYLESLMKSRFFNQEYSPVLENLVTLKNNYFRTLNELNSFIVDLTSKFYHK